MSTIRAEKIATGRLDLLPLRPGHAGEMAAVLADPALYVFTGGAPPSAEALRSRYERLTAGCPDPAVAWCNWVIRLRGERAAGGRHDSEHRLAGTVQATISPSGHGPVAEVAWVVGTGWQGRGIATEAARGLVAWLGRQSVRTVVAHVHPSHRASASVAAAAGLTATGDRQGGEVAWRLHLG